MRVSSITPFSFSCRTEVHFGSGAYQRLIDLLPTGKGSIVLLKGKSNKTSAPIRQLLTENDHHYAMVVCAEEPSIASVNGSWQSVRHHNVDCVIACGGGSVIDTAKALRVALQKGAPLSDEDFVRNHTDDAGVSLIALPTTAGTGAEVTANAVLTASDGAAKISLRGQGLQPSVAIVDPDLLHGAPRSVVLGSGLDAVVQNIEAYTSAFATPFTRALSGPAISSTLTALRDVVETDTGAAWPQLAWGSLSSGIALANGGLGAAHGVASVLGGKYPAPHGALCGRLLVPVLQANLAAARDNAHLRNDILMCQRIISDAFPPIQSSDPFSGFEAWLTAHDLPRLSDWGVGANHIDGLAQAASTASSTLKNPVKLETEELAHILRTAL